MNRDLKTLLKPLTNKSQLQNLKSANSPAKWRSLTKTPSLKLIENLKKSGRLEETLRERLRLSKKVRITLRIRFRLWRKKSRMLSTERVRQRIRSKRLKAR
jgi:hypothetical protein